MIGLWLLACAPVEPSLSSSKLDVSTRIEGKVGKEGGNLIVEVIYDGGGQIELADVQAKGLTVKKLDEKTEQLGRDRVLRQEWSFKGQPGSFEVPPIQVRWTSSKGEEDVASSKSVFIDIERQAPEREELAEIVEPSAVRVVPWKLIIGGVLVVGFMFVGVGFAFTGAKKPSAEEPVLRPADQELLERWEALLADTEATDLLRATELSLAFRRYLERMMGFEATAMTTTEIVDALHYLPKDQVTSAKRLLRAADMVKYADATELSQRLLHLDKDLRGFVGATSGEPS